MAFKRTKAFWHLVKGRFAERRRFGETVHFRPRDILENLGLDALHLKGKTILNIGEGKGKFEKFCRQAGVKQYYGIDPKTLLKRVHKRSIAARAQELPFRTGSVDLVLDHYASLCRTRTPEEGIRIALEALSAGKMFISYPAANAKLVAAALEQQGFHASVSNIFLLKAWRRLLD